MTYFELKDKPDQYFRKIVDINKLVFNEILNIFPDTGKNHDFKTFKNSKPETIILADKGYQGLQKIHGNIFYPLKLVKTILKQVKLKFIIKT